MAALQELPSSTALARFISGQPIAVVTFSAHWCGPCKASKPQLEQMAASYASKSPPVPFAIVYEDVLADEVQNYNVRAFPTYAVYGNGKELGRVQGVNFIGLEQEISKARSSVSTIPTTGGNTLGGGNASVTDARLARLGAVEASSSAVSAKPPADKPVPSDDEATPMDTASEPPLDTATQQPKDSGDVDMANAEGAAVTAGGENVACKSTTASLDALDQDAIKTLTGEMGFSLLRAQKGLLYGNGSTVESAVEWLMEHQEDDNIDNPISEADAAGTSAKAESYKCNECGKILSNIANLELHANQTGHSDFEESTQQIKPLTPEEKAAKVAHLKELLAAKRAQREEAEKVDNVEREKQRRFMGKEMAKTREQMEMEQRKREALARKREKEAFKKERARIRAELEKDRMERMANKGKLSSKLGVEGYNPDAIQYDQDVEGSDGVATAVTRKRQKSTVSAAKIDEYIAKVSSYRAGGDGGKCLKVLKAYVGNVADNPTEPKFRTINTENKAYKAKIKPFLGARHLLQAVGFSPKEGDSTLLVLADDADQQVLIDTKAKLEKALIAFG